MVARICGVALLVCAGLCAAPVQGSEIPHPAMFKPVAIDAGEVTTQQLLADRVAFAKEMYKLTDEQSRQVVAQLEQLVPAHDKYYLGVRKTLRQLRLAISVAANQDEPLAVDRGELMNHFQDQINRMHADAPLSLANVMKLVEPLLPKEQVEAARGRVKAEIAARTKRDPAAIDVAKIDSLLVPASAPEPLPELVTAPEEYTPPPQERQAPPQNQAPASTQPSQTPAPTTKPAAPPKPLPPPPPPPPAPEPLKPAPPEAEWTKQLEALMTKYNFKDDQKSTAEQALKSSLSRASAHREKSKNDYQQAQGVPDAAKRQEAMKKLNEPLDRIYNELMQRVDSIATIEQRLRADGKLLEPRQAATMPAAAQPPAKPPAPSAPPPPQAATKPAEPAGKPAQPSGH